MQGEFDDTQFMCDWHHVLILRADKSTGQVHEDEVTLVMTRTCCGCGMLRMFYQCLALAARAAPHAAARALAAAGLRKRLRSRTPRQARARGTPPAARWACPAKD